MTYWSRYLLKYIFWTLNLVSILKPTIYLKWFDRKNEMYFWMKASMTNPNVLLCILVPPLRNALSIRKYLYWLSITTLSVTCGTSRDVKVVYVLIPGELAVIPIPQYPDLSYTQISRQLAGNSYACPGKSACLGLWQEQSLLPVSKEPSAFQDSDRPWISPLHISPCLANGCLTYVLIS